MADDLGYGDLGCYGQKEIQTPHIDRIAQEGRRFTQCYTGSAVCAPSRNALMTGQHMGHATIRDNKPKIGGIPSPFKEKSIRLPLKKEDYTVAQMLKKAGYTTGITGKWGIGEANTNATPNEKGFDEWLGYLNQDHAVYYYTDYLWKNQEKMKINENQNGKREKYVHDFFTDFSLDFISRNKTKPFFLYCAFTIPHSKFEVPDLGIYANKPWPEDAKIFAAMVSYMDESIGKIMAHLKDLSLDTNTIVFFCSDNGGKNDPFRKIFNSSGGFKGTKGSLSEGGIRTPMLVRWPGRISPRKTDSETVWYFPDFMPTAADLAGLDCPASCDGVSVLPSLLGKAQPELKKRFLYWEFPRRENYFQAVRLDNWKGIRKNLYVPFELYDLNADPAEQNNVADSHPDIIKKIETYLKTARIESPHWSSKRR
jgi:arylsulfatase A-like enzyme